MCVIFVSQNVKGTTINSKVLCIIVTNIFSQVPDLQRHLNFKEPKSDLKAPEITNRAMGNREEKESYHC